MSETMQKCAVCDNGLCFKWADTHGVGVCYECALPYVIYHYDADKKRVDKPPEVAVKEEWLPAARAYYAETKRKVFPGSYSFMSHGGRTYCGATEDDIRAFDNWIGAHEELHPAKAAP
jgi:hypothetical protein